MGLGERLKAGAQKTLLAAGVGCGALVLVATLGHAGGSPSQPSDTDPTSTSETTSGSASPDTQAGPFNAARFESGMRGCDLTFTWRSGGKLAVTAATHPGGFHAAHIDSLLIISQAGHYAHDAYSGLTAIIAGEAAVASGAQARADAMVTAPWGDGGAYTTAECHATIPPPPGH